MIAPFYQVLAPATPPAPTHHATVIVPAPVQTPQSHHVTVVAMGPASVINTVSTSRQNLDTIVQVRHKILPHIPPLEGGVVADICCLCVSLRQSSTSRAPRGRVAPGRKSRGGRSSSLQDVSSLMRQAQTQPQTATGRTTVHCLEFIPDVLRTIHSHARTHLHTSPKPEQGYRSLQTHSAVVRWKSLLVRLKHLFCFLNQYTSCCTVIGSPYGLHLDTHTCSLFCFFSFPLLMSSADPSFTHLHKLSSLNYRKTNRATTSLTINALFYWILELSNVN